MQFATTFLLGASFIGAALAQSQIAFTTLPSAVKAGVPFKLTWGGGKPGLPVTLTLKNGTSTNLLYVATIAGRATGTSYDWTPSSSLANGEYALEISQGLDNINYSGQFTLSGGVPANGIVSSSSASSIMSSSTTSSSTTSSASSGITPIIPIPIPVPTRGSNNTVLTTTTAIGNATVSITTPLSGTGAVASGASGLLATGTVMNRNTTMSSATLKSTSASSTGPSSTSGGSTSTSGGSTTKASTSSTQSQSSTPTGAAMRLGSPVALLLSVFAAVVYLG